jgi:hypothetical protein
MLSSWRAESAAWRDKLGVSPKHSLWTQQPGFKGQGLSKTERNLDILDCVTAQFCKDLPKKTLGPVLAAMENVIVDVSQSHGRKTFTNKDSCNQALTTSTELYSFAKDRVVIPQECMYLHGHSLATVFPHSMTQTDIKVLAGEGMALASVGTILWALYVTKKFPNDIE